MNCVIDVAVALQQRGHRHRQHPIGSRTNTEMNIRMCGDLGAPRIDDDQPCSRTSSRLDHRRQMWIRHVGIGTPHHDQLAVLEVLWIGRRHRAVCTMPGLADDRGTDRDVGARQHRVAPTPTGKGRPGPSCRPTSCRGRAQPTPNRVWLRPGRSSRRTRSRASSHVVATNSPAPFAPTRRNGVVIRSAP